MSYEIITGAERELSDRINGSAVLGPIPVSGAPLGGLTVVFSSPSQIVTFPGAAGALVSPVDVAAELLTVPGLGVELRSVIPTGPYNTNQLRIAIRHNDGFAIDPAGTANAQLGLSTSESTVSEGPDSAVLGFARSTEGNYAVLRQRS